MEYKKLTAIEAENLTPGIVINFGNGILWEVSEVGSPEMTRLWEDGAMKERPARKVKIKNLSTGKIQEDYAYTLTQGTTESADPTIEKCGQCWSLRPSNEMKTALIWERKPLRQVPGRFCADKQCAEERQMGAEG